MENKLEKAREYEAEKEKCIHSNQKPGFHLIPRIGWMNDPNGFSYYDGKFHLFYQYNPYDTVWGPMHWGHAVSSDLLHWENLPAALAPDMPYDDFGCFSGSAIEYNGKHLLVYTGVTKTKNENGEERDLQRQCVAFGDGVNYQKVEGNPVIDSSMLPLGASKYDFRDPKVWVEGDKLCCVVANMAEGNDGQLLKFESKDALTWNYTNVFLKNNHRYGTMWECPDVFEIEGKTAVIVSTVDMLPETLDFHSGNGTIAMIGHVNADGTFEEETCKELDYGIDFYAPQTLLLPDGRRVIIGWMQNWETTGFRAPDMPWFGQMSLPREITYEDGTIKQKPIREIETLYSGSVKHENVSVKSRVSLPEVSGRSGDMTVHVHPCEALYHKFEVRFADDGKHYSTCTYDPVEGVLEMNRSHAGSRKAIMHERRCKVLNQNGEITLRFVFDKFGVELFVNDGEQVMSMAFFTDLAADKISFKSIGETVLDVTMHRI